VTPVLAMLHALATAGSTREIWWLYGTRSGREHPFAAEVRRLLDVLDHRQSCTYYSSPGPADRPSVDFDAARHLYLRRASSAKHSEHRKGSMLAWVSCRRRLSAHCTFCTSAASTIVPQDAQYDHNDLAANLSKRAPQEGYLVLRIGRP
jgi:hypothetical protein